MQAKQTQLICNLEYYIEGIKQRRACLYPVLETCYDAAEHEKALRENEAKPSFLSALRVFRRVRACF